MKKSLFLALIPMTALLGVAGCDEGYSDAVFYELRTDPMKVGNKIEIEPTDPDRPGQLPLLKISDLDNPHNPYYAKHKENNLVEDGRFRDPMQASSTDRAAMKKALDEFFGTPAKPKAGPMETEDRELLKLSDESLAKGSKLYRIQCLHCHGVTGDGRGPTGRWVNPHPRDYRQSVFKFQSVDQSKARTPHRNDLLRILENGVEGTAMPSFALLSQDDRENLVSYVIHLSLRGVTEFKLFEKSFDYDKATHSLKFIDKTSMKESAKQWYDSWVKEWVKSQAEESLIKVGAYSIKEDDPDYMEKFKASVLRGKMIFEDPPEEIKKKIGANACLSCHKEYGRRSTYRQDSWGTFSKPNNLTQGVYRGGRRPVDIYYRIHSGIDPSGMIAFGEFFRPDQLWDVVNFVKVLGNPNMRRQMGIFVD
jgi:mono/diheme cytochrome c family protein